MSTLKIGDEVVLPQGQSAVLRWIGHIPGRQPTEFAGVEVLGPDAELHGKHSGTYKDQQIFQTSKPDTGLFVSYVQLLSCNVRGPSPAPVNGAELAPQGGAAPRGATPGGSTPGSSTPGGSTPGGSSSSAERQFFRDTLAAVTAKSDELARTYEERIGALRREFDEQIRRARRSSAMLPSGVEVDEQRLALAAMQNKLLDERAAKQEENDRLRSELQHLRKLAGGVDDLEALIADIQSNEQHLAQLRSKVEGVDALKQQLADALRHSTELELALQRQKDPKDPPAKRDTEQQAQLERQVAQLERQLEAKLLRESELEAETDALKARTHADAAEIAHLKAELEKKATQMPGPLAPATPGRAEPERVEDVSMLDVPVPDKLTYDDSMDIAAGRTDWCSLCERQGHVTTECPF